MPVTDPNDMSRAFVEAVNAGDIDSLLGLYEPNIRYVARSGETLDGLAAVRKTLERLVSMRAQMRIDNRHCIVNGDIALVRGEWSFSGIADNGKPIKASGNSAEVLHRGPDGLWRYLIDHPFGAD